jgi:hypothetical protein
LAKKSPCLKECFLSKVSEFKTFTKPAAEYEVKLSTRDDKTAMSFTCSDAAVSPYSADAQTFLQSSLHRIKQDQMEVDKQTDKPRVAIDEHEDLKNCEVVRSEIAATNHFADSSEANLFYDVALIKIDVKAGYYGINVFYVIQLLFDKVKQIYILWTRWGRFGEFGQYQRTPFPTLLAAQLEFAKVFR